LIDGHLRALDRHSNMEAALFFGAA
jgi:hypothetical protein